MKQIRCHNHNGGIPNASSLGLYLALRRMLLRGHLPTRNRSTFSVAISLEARWSFRALDILELTRIARKIVEY